MSLETALAEIKRAEGILRSRYHYEHSIFGHLAEARAAVEAEMALVAPPTPVPEPEAEPETADDSSATTGNVTVSVPEPTEGKQPARGQGRSKT